MPKKRNPAPAELNDEYWTTQGHATLTLSSQRTGNRYTYKISRSTGGLRRAGLGSWKCQSGRG